MRASNVVYYTYTYERYCHQQHRYKTLMAKAFICYGHILATRGSVVGQFDVNTFGAAHAPKIECVHFLVQCSRARCVCAIRQRNELIYCKHIVFVLYENILC